jgi:hypothetical protein
VRRWPIAERIEGVAQIIEDIFALFVAVVIVGLGCALFGYIVLTKHAWYIELAAGLAVAVFFVWGKLLISDWRYVRSMRKPELPHD